MRKFLRDCRGAVTVFVTLLLIPATLICGTGVDIARLFAARSVVQDANQLAANSVLASYDAMLQDLYGLFGVMKDDPTLAGMIDDYIQVSVFGEDWQEEGMGTFQLFYGSNLNAGEIVPAADKNLKNQEVLRRQIEEYAKFRAPVIIVEEILGILDSFEKVKADAKVIKTKMDLDDKVEDIEKIYKRIYAKIQEVNQIEQHENSAMQSVNTYLKNVHEELKSLYNTRWMWTEGKREGRMEEYLTDLETKFQDIKDNIASLLKGGTVQQGWIPGDFDGSGEFQEGYWASSYKSDGLSKAIGDWKKTLENDMKLLAELEKLCQSADEKKSELEELLSDLEGQLNSGECSSDLKKGMEQKDADGKSTLDRYRDLLKYKLEPMASAVSAKNGPQIQSVIDLLDTVCLKDQSDGSPSISLNNLKDLDHISEFSIAFELENEQRAEKLPDTLKQLQEMSNCSYSLPGKFLLFQDSSFTTKNREFYQVLESMYKNEGDSDKKDTAKQAVTSLFSKAQGLFDGWTYEPEGAWKYKEESPANDSSNFGSGTDWGDEDAAKDETKNALNGNLLSSLGDMAGKAADKILLLTYCSEMFSCYSTEEDGSETNMAGIPLSTDVNYYFQSELEYLYNGDLHSAKNNLKAVTSMLFLVRFVFDYVASFSISEVNTAVNGVKAALSGLGPFAFVIAELARVAIAMAEAALDVKALRSGAEIALYKTNSTWRFSVSGAIDAAAGTAGEITSKKGDQDSDPEPALSYKDYVRLFLLLKDGDTLAQRASELISLNVTNKKENIGNLSDRTAREDAMSKAERFDMGQAITDFSLTTTVDLRMLFLSMPLFQRGVNGTVPPGTLALSVTDYRGF